MYWIYVLKVSTGCMCVHVFILINGSSKKKKEQDAKKNGKKYNTNRSNLNNLANLASSSMFAPFQLRTTVFSSGSRDKAILYHTKGCSSSLYVFLRAINHLTRRERT